MKWPCTRIGTNRRPLHRPARIRQRGLVSGIERARMLGDGAASSTSWASTSCAWRRAVPPAPYRRIPPRPNTHRSSDQRPARSAGRYQRRQRRPEIHGVATASIENSTLGFEAPVSLSPSRASRATNTTLWSLPATNMLSSPGAAAATVTPFLQGWLGQRPAPSLSCSTCPTPKTRLSKPAACSPPLSARPRQSSWTAFWPRPHSCMDGISACLALGGCRALHGYPLGGKAERADTALEELEASRPALALAELPARRQFRTTLALAIAPFTTHQGHLCPLDAA